MTLPRANRRLTLRTATVLLALVGLAILLVGAPPVSADDPPPPHAAPLDAPHRLRVSPGGSWTVVRLEDQIFATQVIFAEENQPSLLGVVTLEDALLAVDPVGQRLVPVEAERL